MMKNVKRCLSLLVLGATIGVTQVSAQNLRDSVSPAEFPPSSFKGKQYVDSKGCVFIRAGVDGAVTWVPRVARNRKVICGFQPSQVAGAGAAPARSRNAGATVIAAANPENATGAGGSVGSVGSGATVAIAAAPVANVANQRPRVLQPARAAAPVTARPVQIQPAAVAGPASRPYAPQGSLRGNVQGAGQGNVQVIRVAPAPQAAAQPRYAASTGAPRVASGVGDCFGSSPDVQQYLGNSRQKFRCGKTTGYDPVRTRALAYGVTPGSGGSAPRVGYQAPAGLAAPVYGAARVPTYGAAPVNTRRVFEVPATKVVRVAPAARAHQSQISPQARVVPRHVYEERALSRDVQVPKGYKPVWDDDRLNPYRAEQTLAGKRQMEQTWSQTVPRELNKVVISPSAAAPVYRAPQYRVPQYGAPQFGQQPYRKGYGVTGHVSSRGKTPKLASTASVQPQARASAPAGRYVQIATFSNAQNAQATAQRLAAGGVRVSVSGKGNRKVVLAGPFSTDSDVAHAMAAARRAGFYDAFPRR